jgi:sugar (pentulose or hexulose) kinase
MPAFLALDLGTTHFKAAVFNYTGRIQAHASRATPLRHAPEGFAIYTPREVWETVSGLLAELHARHIEAVSRPEPVAAIGIASMAETGLLVDRGNGTVRSPFLPWFDRLAATQADSLARRSTFSAEFCRHGVRPTFKCSLAKLLWLQARDATQLDGAVWLSMADYLAFRLTGAFGTHANLAVRSAAFCLDVGKWDAQLLDELHLPPQIFPPVLTASLPVGGLSTGFEAIGMAAGTPVIIAGHDHLCGAIAAYTIAGGLKRRKEEDRATPFTHGHAMDSASNAPNPALRIPYPVYQSIGTAESLVGAFPARPLDEADFLSGFSFSLQAIPGWMAWVGGISASGGSVEWLRGILGESQLSYAELDALLEGTPRPPTGIVYLPYLNGRGSPHSDGRTQAAFIGLNAAHGRAELYQAVLEGVAYEVEYIRRAAQNVTGQDIQRIIAAGGGARNRVWMQIRADVLGCPVDVLDQPETTLLGAALLAGLGAGIYTNEDEVSIALAAVPIQQYMPNATRHAAYRQIYEDTFLRWLS